jgi:hypothetical protein
MKIVIVLLVVEAKCGVFESTWKCILGNKFNYFKPNKNSSCCCCDDVEVFLIKYFSDYETIRRWFELE